MNIVNILLILLVIIIVSIIIIYNINKKKKEKEEESEDLAIDDKTFKIDTMMAFVKRRLDEITKINLYDIGLSEEELKRRKAKKYE